MLSHPVGRPPPPLLPPGSGVHPLFGPRAPPVAPPHEGYQRADHPLVWGLQAGGLTGLRRAVGVCGEGGMGRRNALRGERVRRRAGKQLASE